MTLHQEDNDEQGKEEDGTSAQLRECGQKSLHGIKSQLRATFGAGLGWFSKGAGPSATAISQNSLVLGWGVSRVAIPE